MAMNPRPEKQQRTLSICIPTYNRAGFLDQSLVRIRECIQVAKERWGGFEVVVSDNVSTDETPQVMAKYAEVLPVSYYRRSINIGGSRNLLYAIEMAQNDYVWALSDDDSLVKNAFVILADFLDANPTVDYIFIARQMADRQLEPIDGCVSPPNLTGDLIFSSGRELFSGAGGHMPGILAYISSTILRRKILVNIQLDGDGRLSGFSHLAVILESIADCRSGIIAQPGVLCRLNNDRVFDVNSIIWFDEYITVFLLAKRLGYSPESCDGIIDHIIDSFSRCFVIDKIRGRRRDSIPSALKRIGLSRGPRKLSMWIFLSCLPQFMLLFLAPVYHLKKKMEPKRGSQ